jgi:hypothetical protein
MAMDEAYKIWVGVIGLLLLGAVGWKLWNGFKTAVKTAVDDNFKTITGQITEINTRLDKVNMEACKNFLVRCLADIDRGDELTETEAQRFKEQYDYYIKHDGNTYIKDKYEKSKSEGKL